jgi:hypothetical protein
VPEQLLGSYFKELTRNIAKLIRGLDEEALAQGVAEKAAALIHGEAKALLMTNLNDAISKVPEYNYPAFTGPLHRCFNSADIITYSRNGVNINAEAIAGNWSELWAGVVAAKETLSVGKKLSPEEASAFWRHRIYGPAREGRIPKGEEEFASNRKTRKTRKPRKNERIAKQYDYLGYGEEKYRKTIEARKSGWTKAPYWLWLENGNMETPLGEGGTPYPLNSPTRFVYLSKIAIQYMYQDAISNVAEKFTEGFTENLKKFFENPSAFQPGELLTTLEVSEDIKRIVFVTPTGRLGYRTVRR